MANLSLSSCSSFESLSSSLPPPTSSAAFFFCDSTSDDEMKHAGYSLDSCFLCGTRLHVGDDIYMYRGDTPFCSEECRQEQIDIDEAEERDRTKKMSKKNLKAKISNTTLSSKSHEIHVRAAETVVAG